MFLDRPESPPFIENAQWRPPSRQRGVTIDVGRSDSDQPSHGPGSRVTQDLRAATEGDHGAADRVWGAVYGELRRIAHRELRSERPDAPLSTTELVHETYFKLVDQTAEARRNRSYFYALACRAMRQVLVDFARRRGAAKRASGERPLPLKEAMDDAGRIEPDPDMLLALDEALTRLEGFQERLARIVELRFFGGLTAKEAADVLDLSERTVERDWQRARAYLYQILATDPGPGSSHG